MDFQLTPVVTGQYLLTTNGNLQSGDRKLKKNEMVINARTNLNDNIKLDGILGVLLVKGISEISDPGKEKKIMFTYTTP